MPRLIVFFVVSVGIIAISAFSIKANDVSDSSQLEDTPQPFVPKIGRNEAEQDRVEAAAMYAHGRMLFRRQEHASALRRYQRAWRYDSTATQVLDQILQLALGLKRNGEFMRYAVIRGESDPRDSVTLRRLAEYLTDQQQYDRALGLYEKSLKLPANKDVDGSTILIRQRMGRLYFVTEQSDKAATEFKLVLDALDDPKRFGLNDELQKSLLGDASKTYHLFAEVFLDVGNFDDAEAMFKKADEVKEDKALLAFNMARVLEKRDKPDEALKSLNQYLDSGNDSARIEPYQLLGRLLKTKLGDENKAMAELRNRTKALYEKKPNSSLGLFVAEQALEADDFDFAAKVYSSINDDKATLDTLQGLIEVYRRQGDAENLLSTFGNAILKTGTLELLGDAATKVSDNAELLTKMMNVARDQAKDDNKSLAEGAALALGQLSVAAKQFEHADEFYELALAGPKPEKRQVLLTWGLDMFMAEQNDRAAKVFQRGIDEGIAQKDSPDLYFYLAGALEMRGKTEEAIKAAKKAISIQPKTVRLQSRVPWILYHAKRYEEAEREYLAVLKKFDGDHNSPATRDTVRSTRLVLSNLCVVQDRMSESEEWLEQVLDEFPEDIGAKNDLGYLWADQGKRLDRARVMVQTAVAAEPENEAYRDSLGWVYFRLKRFDEAVKELEKAASGEDPDGVILDHLGDAYQKTNQVKRAVETWKRAAKSFKKQDETDMLKKTEKKIEQHSAE